MERRWIRPAADMRQVEGAFAPRLLLLLALVVLVLHLGWSLRTPVAPNADRYDYLARAESVLEGDGPGARVEYPLRFAFKGAETLPTVDVVRPPLWPTLLVPALLTRAGDAAGSWLAFFAAIAICFVVDRLAGDRFGRFAGAAAALAFACSFATRRAMWGGGPELALALVLISLWGFAPVRAGSGLAHVACASLFGALPALHPTGWLLAVLAAFARPARYAARWMPWMIVTGLLIAAPWYLRNQLAFGVFGGSLQAQAELAKSLDDPGGLGPYLTLEPAPNWQVARDAPGRLLRLWLSRVKQWLLHLDGWLAWPLVALAIWGCRADPPLARRDLLLGAMGAGILLLFSAEARLFVPLLPLATVWVGAGASDLCRRGLPWPAIGLLAIAPWLLPMGASMRPGEELAQVAPERLDPPTALLDAIARAEEPGRPFLVESSVVAWRSSRPAIFVPREATTLDALRRRAPLQGLSLLVLGAGRDSRWIQHPSWQPQLDRAEILYEDRSGAVVLRLGPQMGEGPRAPGPGNEIPADFVPMDLVEIPLPPASRGGIELREPCWKSLGALLAAAESEGNPLRVVSGYRSYAYQERLYRSAQDRHGSGQRWVARPGESEHQLGEAVDLADAAMAHVLEASFGDTPEGVWLRQNVRRFGFRITYSQESEEATGIRAEPWHIRCLEKH